MVPLHGYIIPNKYWYSRFFVGEVWRIHRVRTGPGNPGKPWKIFEALEIPGNPGKALEFFYEALENLTELY